MPSQSGVYWPTMKILAAVLWVSFAIFAQTPTPADSIEAARKGPESAEMKRRVAGMTAATQVSVWGQDYLFLAASASPVTISVDLQPQRQLSQVDGNHWMMLTKMRTGVLHQYQFYTAGKPLGARGDAVGYNPDSYPKPGVPHGKLSEKHTITSKIYYGTKSDYWVYASPGVDPNVPSPLMVWQDGQNLIRELSGIRLITVAEN